jgi:hypothetical protein
MPSNTVEYMNDEQIHANHSQEKLTSDYIRDFEENEESFIKSTSRKGRTEPTPPNSRRGYKYPSC